MKARTDITDAQRRAYERRADRCWRNYSAATCRHVKAIEFAAYIEALEDTYTGLEGRYA